MEFDLPPDFTQVSESTIKLARDIEGSNSPFAEAIAMSKEYKKAELHPVFFLNYKTHTIHVTTAEKMNHVYH